MVFIQKIVYLCKGWPFIINLDGYKSVGNNWVALYLNDNNVAYFDSFIVEYISKEIKIFLDSKAITTGIHRIQLYDSAMRGYFCIKFIDFMLSNKRLGIYLPQIFLRIFLFLSIW